MTDFPHPFALRRVPREPGCPGTVTVATGVVFPDGTVALRPTSGDVSTVVLDSIEDMVRTHGGSTRVIFADATGGPFDQELLERIHQGLRGAGSGPGPGPGVTAPCATVATALTVMAVVQPEIDRLTRELHRLIESVGGKDAATTSIRNLVLREAAEAELHSMHRERAHLLAGLAAHQPKDAFLTPAAGGDGPGGQTLHLTLGGQRRTWYIQPAESALFEHVRRVPRHRVHRDDHTTSGAGA